MTKNERPVKGTVSMTVKTMKDGSKATLVDAEKVLRAYSNWGEIPKHFGNDRAAELGFVCTMALDLLRAYRKLKREAKRGKNPKRVARKSA